MALCPKVVRDALVPYAAGSKHLLSVARGCLEATHRQISVKRHFPILSNLCCLLRVQASCCLCCLPLPPPRRSPPLPRLLLSPPSFWPSPARASVPPIVRAAVARRFERSICVRMVFARYETTRTSWMWALLVGVSKGLWVCGNGICNVQVTLNIGSVDLGR